MTRKPTAPDVDAPLERDRRSAIIASTVETFGRRGFHGSTTKQLAEAAGISEALIYRYFANKEDLFDAVLEYLVASSRHILSGLDSAEGLNDREFLVRLAESLHAHYTAKPAEVRLLLYAALEGHALAVGFFERQVKDIYAALEARIRRGQSQKRYRPMPPRTAARAFIGMTNYHILIEVLLQGSGPREERDRLWAEKFADIFLEGLTQ